jgi:hypothetical protein
MLEGLSSIAQENELSAGALTAGGPHRLVDTPPTPIAASLSSPCSRPLDSNGPRLQVCNSGILQPIHGAYDK